MTRLERLGLGLTPAALADRRNGIGGSDANIIMSGDAARINALWAEKLGDATGDDLSGNLAVAMGSHTEELNRAWFEREMGRVVHSEGTTRQHSTLNYLRLTLDGITATDDGQPAMFEAKHSNTINGRDDLLARYMPQLHHGMNVCGFDYAYLSVFQGNSVWWTRLVRRDEAYADALQQAEEDFWLSVLTRTPPIPAAPVAPPIAFEDMREADMTGNNKWADAAIDWIGNRKAARLFEASAKSLKETVPADIRRAFGHGIEATRSKTGALTIKELKK